MGLALGVLLCAGPGRAADPAAATSPTGAPVQLAPYEVKANPFGYLGIKRARFTYNFLRLATLRKALLYVEIDELYPDSPAREAGVNVGDRIIELNGQPIQKWSMRQLIRYAETLEIGTRVRVRVQHPADESVRTVEVVVARTPRKPAPGK